MAESETRYSSISIVQDLPSDDLLTWPESTLIAESRGLLNGRYEPGTTLGRGGMGVVYRAIDRQHPDRALAVKCIHSDS